MLRQVAYVAAFVVILTTLFVAVERTSSPFFQACINEQGDHKAQHAAEENPATFGTVVTAYVRCSGRFIDRHDASITALATIIIAAFTFTLWVSNEKMWSATEKTVELTRQSLIASQRAWLTVEISLIDGQKQIIFGKDGAVLPIRIDMKNIGTAPAIKVSWHA